MIREVILLFHKRKNRQEIINSICVGNIVAFTVELYNDKLMLSGKVIEVIDNLLAIQTHNGSIFYTAKNSVAWVKTGSTWPLGIYNALKYRDFDSVANRSNQR